RAVPALVRAAAELDHLRDDPRVRDARHAIGEIIASAAGLYARATATRPVAAPGSTVEVTMELVARALPITVQRIEIPGASPLAAGKPLTVGKRERLPLSVTVPASAPPSTAYWLTQPATPGHYVVGDAHMIGTA